MKNEKSSGDSEKKTLPSAGYVEHQQGSLSGQGIVDV